MVVPIYVRESQYIPPGKRLVLSSSENTYPRQSNFTTRYGPYCMASKDKNFMDHSYEYEVCMKIFYTVNMFYSFYNTNNREDFP